MTLVFSANRLNLAAKLRAKVLKLSRLWGIIGKDRLIAALANTFAPLLAPLHYVSVEERTYIAEKDKKLLQDGLIWQL